MINREQNGKHFRYFSKISSLERFNLKFKSRFEQLTPREVQILGLISHDMDLSVAAKLLNLPEPVAQECYNNICNKLAIKDPSDFIKYALAFGLMKF